MLGESGRRLRQGGGKLASIKRLGLLLALFSLALLLGAKMPFVKDHPLCRVGFLEMVSPDNVSAAEGRQVAKMALAAYKFDLDQNHWGAGLPMGKPLKFRLLSVERMQANHGGLLGYATSPGDVFVASTAVLEDPLAQGTLAHELAHIQAFRALRTNNAASKVPSYFLEAHGLGMGKAYRAHLGIPPQSYDLGVARTVAKLNAEEVRLIMTTGKAYFRKNGKLAGDKHAKMEFFAVFWAEYLKVQMGVPDALNRMGRVFERVGAGQTYAQAFQATYGFTLNHAISEVTAFFQQTEGSPAARLKGTYYEQFSHKISRPKVSSKPGPGQPAG